MKTRFLLSILLFAFAITGSGPVLARQQAGQCVENDTLFEQILLTSFFDDLEAMGYKFEPDAVGCWLHVSTRFFANDDGRPTLATHFSLVMENGDEMKTPEMIKKNSAKLTVLTSKVEGILSRFACIQSENNLSNQRFDDPGGFVNLQSPARYAVASAI